MEQFEVIPLNSSMGVVLGWTREETLDAIGAPESTVGKIDYYHQRLPNFHVHYNEQGLVEFIEVANPMDGQIKVLLLEVDLFNTPADKVISEIENLARLTFDQNDPELPYSYTFPGLELSFWRPTVPEDEKDEDGRFFESVGIGIKGYYIE